LRTVEPAAPVGSIAEIQSNFSGFWEVSKELEAQPGDVIVVESERVAQPARRGVIEEVLQEEPPRLRVRWDDGHASILTPSAGTARIERRKKARRPKGI
jgi:hypothetical protein